MEKYRTFWPRFVAQLIDGFIMVPLFAIMALAPQYGAPPAFQKFWFGVSVAVQLGYLVFMHAKWGQTLGKMYMEVKVVGLDERPISWRQALVRQLPDLILGALIVGAVQVYGVPSADENGPPPPTVLVGLNSLKLLWSLADVTWFLLDPRRRAFHDVIAGTVVVRTVNNVLGRTE